MLRNHWLRQIKLKDFRQKAEVVLYTMEVDDLCLDWHTMYFDGRYSWNEPLIIALDDERPVYGYHVFYEGKVVFYHSFQTTRYIRAGDTITLYLDAERACPL